MSFFNVLQLFFEDLRQEGIPVLPGQAEDCCRALLLVDWSIEDYFYITLFSTLVKEKSYEIAFRQVYEQHFSFKGQKEAAEKQAALAKKKLPIENVSSYAGDALPVQGMQSLRGGLFRLQETLWSWGLA